jgi:kynurenine formamidase
VCLAETTHCAPHRHAVDHEHTVDDRPPTDGERRAIDRRSFMRAGAAVTIGTAATTLGVAVPAAAGDRTHTPRGSRRRVVDLTHRFTTDFPTFEHVQPTRQDLTTFESNGYYSQRWTFGEHTATHVDAPGHFAPGQPLVDELDPDALVCALVVVDITRKAQQDPNAMVAVDDLRRHERRHGRIPRGALVCMNSGWSDKADDPAAFKGGDAFPDYNFPGFSVEAAMWLAQRRDIAAIAVDTMSLDPGNSTTFPVHNEFLATGRYGIESLANLSAVTRDHSLAVVGAVPWEDGSGGPCRVLAL